MRNLEPGFLLIVPWHILLDTGDRR